MPVLLAAAGFLLVGLDGSVNIAFPAMAAAFRVSTATVRWVIIYYVGTYAMTAFAAGVLADRLGPGRVVRAGLVLSLFCFASYALVTSFEMLLVVRVLQGVSGGLIYGAAPALVTLSLPPSRHGWGLGWASTGLGLGLSVSPFIGGVLVGAFGWRGAFLYRVPIAAAMIVLAAWTTALANYAQFAVWLLVPFYLVVERGLSAAAGGLLFMLTPLATGIVAPVAGRMADRLGPRGPMVAGLAAEAAGLLLVARCGDGTPLVLVGGALALVGLGLGVFQVPNIAQVMAAFPPRQQGAAGGFAFLSRTSGVVVGVEAAAWLFHERLLTLGFLPAFRFTFAAAAAVCSAAAIIALLPGLSRAPRATR